MVSLGLREVPPNEIKQIKENLPWLTHVWVVFSASEVFPLFALSFKLVLFLWFRNTDLPALIFNSYNY